MSMNDLEEVFELIESNADLADFAGPKSEGLLRKAEQALGLSFPPTYRRFLSHLGCGDIAGAEFYGVISDGFSNSGVPDAIGVTLRARTDCNLPKTHIVVGGADYGSYYAIDCSISTDVSENPVVEWLLTGEQWELAKDFGEFFLQLIREALDDSDS
jgi:hypothetical protein